MANRVASLGAQPPRLPVVVASQRRMAMATLDFTPLFRSSVGFDRVPTLLAHAMQREDSGYPPYNIEKCGEDQYRIVMAVAGFSKEDIEVIAEHNRLTVRGQINKERDGRTY